MDGVIFDIKEFAIYDGPGIRQTVFMKGCPLHCAWCHNPEGMSPEKELMVSGASCGSCGKCIEVCPNGCDRDKCTLCGKCTDVCPLGLRKICGERISADALAERILKNAEATAGVTFSGGEPLMQYNFLTSVINKLGGLHTAVETCGYASSAAFLSAISACDFIMMDLKLMDNRLHKLYTGVSNDAILENFGILKASGKPFIIRIPLIPGVNDNRDNSEKTARFISGSANLIRVELLPYHATAGAKYSSLGRKYTPGFDGAAPVALHTEIFGGYGISCKVL